MKLVRDEIPDLYPQGRYRRVKDSREYQRLLLQKLTEETGALMGTLTKEDLLQKLADILDVVYARAEVHDAPADELNLLRIKQLHSLGAYDVGWVQLGPSEE